MKCMKPIFIFLLLSTVSANADIFKCKSSAGEMVYQPAPCTPPGETPVGKLNIKAMTPQEAEKAKALRDAEEQEEAAYDSEKAKAEKARQIELTRQKELELEARRVKAQEDEANSIRSRAWRPPQPIYR